MKKCRCRDKITNEDIDLYVKGAERELTRLHQRFIDEMRKGKVEATYTYLMDVIEVERKTWIQYRREKIK